MKYVVFFLLVCVALAAAAPQYITGYPGLVGPIGTPLGPIATPLGPIGTPLGLRTLVAGPTVVNGAFPTTIGGRIITSQGLFGGNILI